MSAPAGEEALARLGQRHKGGLPAYAAGALKIRTKAGRIAPLALNRAQLAVHARLEAQKARTGKVRALVLKARQQGFSTYIQARFFWQVTHRRGMQAFILTHRGEATDNLFAMAERFLAHCRRRSGPRWAAATRGS